MAQPSASVLQRSRQAPIPRPEALVLGEGVGRTDGIDRALGRLELSVVECSSLEEAEERIERGAVALVVLVETDGGLDLAQSCRWIRSHYEVPVFALSSARGRWSIIDLLEAGADDCLQYPFELDLFLARVKAVMRRSVNLLPRAGVILCRDLRIDLERFEVTKKGKRLDLTPTEFRLLTCLARHGGRVVDSRTLIQAVHGYTCNERDAQLIVKAHMVNLRRKVSGDPREYPYIHRVRGFGYMLERRKEARQGDPVLNHLEPWDEDCGTP